MTKLLEKRTEKAKKKIPLILGKLHIFSGLDQLVPDSEKNNT